MTDEHLDRYSGQEDRSEYLNAVVDIVLELIPQVELKSICTLVEEHLASYGPAHVVEFVVEQIFQDIAAKSAAEPVEANPLSECVKQPSPEEVTYAECECCIEDIPTAEVVYCSSKHPFCRQCVRRYASHQLGLQVPRLFCMHTGGCDSTYARSDLQDTLSAPLFSLFERLEQRMALKEADLSDFEECPFCDWGCIMEFTREDDASFVCGNREGGCGITSCRVCKKNAHPAQTCDEADGKETDKTCRLAIEEAMTAAMARRCPQCQASTCLFNAGFEAFSSLLMGSRNPSAFVKHDGVSLHDSVSLKLR